MRRLDAKQFAELYADYILEPWGDDWTQTAFLAAQIANYSGRAKKDLGAKDFMPGRLGAEARSQAQSQEEIRQRIDTVMRAAQRRAQREKKQREQSQRKS